MSKITVPGLEDPNTPRGDIELESNDIPFGQIAINGNLVPQTLVCCPECGDPRIEMQATATFRLTNQHVWAVAPVSQDDLREELNQDDNPCNCINCEWSGFFSELLNFEPK